MKLVIVESPSKTKKIEKFLGQGWRVVASYGHVRDLPNSTLGVDVDNDFNPTYEISPSKTKTVKFLTDAARKADAIYLAADPDREGEAIAWHLAELLNAACPVHRVTFNQITKGAIKTAFDDPRKIDYAMVDSQQTRRILDRLVGWKISPVLRLAFRESLSAGRVQSVAVRLVVDREQEIENFTPEQSWSISVTLLTKDNEEVTAKLTALLNEEDKELDPKRLPEERAKQIAGACSGNPFNVSEVTAKETSKKPPPPFITSTLQQKASSQLKMKPKRAMEVAQKLYEQGHITYMRTDSVHTAQEAVQAAREVIGEHFPQALPDKPLVYTSKADAQEAHECIRPTEPALLPDNSPISGAGLALYRLIWTRFIASQMKPATYNVVVATIIPRKSGQDQPYEFTAKGKTLTGPGWLVTKNQNDKDDDDEQEDQNDKDDALPRLQANQILKCTKIDTSSKWTKPPSRFSEPKLIRTLEKAGVGRPSTYASIIETIQERGYVTDTGKSLAATESGTLVTQFLVQHFPDLLSVDFTKQMEDDLDRVAKGEIKWQALLEEFYSKLTQHLAETKQALIDSGVLSPCPKCDGVIATLVGKYGEFQCCLNCDYKPNSATETGEKCPKCEKPLVERDGKHGKFVSCSGYPECKYRPTDISGEPTGENCPKCKKPLVERDGQHGKFVSCSGYPECKYRPNGSTQTGKKCPKCKKPLVERDGKYGKFTSCSGYPKCRYRPTDTKSTGEKCPKCKSALVEKKGRYGPFVSCSGYPKCRYIKS